MEENRYRGAQILNYKQADLSELKYIKIIYSDISGEVHEFRTITNFLSDNYISLYVKRTKEARFENEDDKDDPIEIWGHGSRETDTKELSSQCDEYLKKLAEIKAIKEKADMTGDYDEYHTKLAEIRRENKERENKLKQESWRKKEEQMFSEEEILIKEQEENIDQDTKKYEVECPQQVTLKFVIGDLLYIGYTELKGVDIKSTRVYFSLKAPVLLNHEQHRKFYRIDLKRFCMLIATKKNGGDEAYIARSINLSAGGVLINKLESMTSNDYITINPDEYEKFNLIIVLELDKIIKMSARYVRQEEGKKCWRYAFEFTDMPEEKTNYISKYVIGKQIEELGVEFKAKFTAVQFNNKK